MTYNGPPSLQEFKEILVICFKLLTNSVTGRLQKKFGCLSLLKT